jgi:hypothetical protein
VIIICAHCGKESDKPSGQVTRARNAGLNLYCDRACSGLGRRSKVQKTKEQKIAEKAAYDAQRRLRLADEIKARKREYHKRTYDPAKAAEKRKQTMPRHVEYCRRPEYRARKRDYDKEYRAKQEFGEFWESAMLILDIHRTATNLAGGAYELRKSKGYYDRQTQQRRRDYERLDREEPEIGALGNLERGERW